MLSALQRHFPPLASWTVPNGGTFLCTIARQSTNVGNLPASLITEYFHCGGNTIFPGQQGYPASA